MSRLSRSTATTPSKRLLTASNRTRGRTPGSLHGAKPARMNSLARSVAGLLDGDRRAIDQPVICRDSRLMHIVEAAPWRWAPRPAGLGALAWLRACSACGLEMLLPHRLEHRDGEECGQ